MKHHLFIALAFAASTSSAQQPMTTPADFDFWLGEWKLTWEGGTGTNSISKEMNGLLIHERFTDPGQNYHGESWTMWDAQHKLWKQTWVDDQGNYLSFEGGVVPEGIRLTTYLTDKKDGVRYLYHMVFSDITAKSFNWTWKRSADEGKTWAVKWAIRYERMN